METDIKVAEHDWVQEVDDRLRNYFDNRGMFYRSYVSRETRQNFFDLDQHCADLVGCIGGWQPLLLEFKVHHERVLPSFEKTQHEGLEVLNSFGIPVQYCFNKLPAPSEASDEEFLDNLLVCKATPLPGRRPALTHASLLQQLKSVGTGVPPSLTPLAICDARLFPKARLGQLNTARLLILADGLVSNLSIEDGVALVGALLGNKTWARDKNVSRLRQDLDALLSERDELLSRLSAAGWGTGLDAQNDVAEQAEPALDEDTRANDRTGPSF